MSLKEMEQGSVLAGSDEELSTIKQRLKDYRETTQMQDDLGKYSKAMQNISQATNLTELTMLALKITEETKRGETNTD